MKLLIYDYETTGVDTNTAQVLGFAGIVFDTETKEVFEVKSFHDCKGEIPEQATNVHGITKEMVSGKPLFDEKSMGLKFVKNYNVLAGYNHQHYDNKISYRLGVNTFSKTNIDVFSIVKEKKVELGLTEPKYKFNLSNVYKSLTGKEPVGAHDALNDCRMTLELLLILDEKFNILSKGDETPVDFNVHVGKYKGLSFSQVAKEDREYALWFSKNVEVEVSKKNFMKTLGF